MYLVICGFTIKINLIPTEKDHLKRNFKGEIFKAFQEFIIFSKPKKIDFNINITYKNRRETLFKNKQCFLNIYKIEKEDSLTTYYWLSIFEFKMIISNILQLLLIKHMGFVLHASAVDINNKAHIFLGKSGAGKSTVSDILAQKYNKLADDSLIIRKIDNQYYLYQLPFIEKSYLKKKNKKYIIKQIYFLHKEKYFKINKAENKKQILLLLKKQILIDKETIKTQMAYLFEFISKSDLFSFLYFSKDPDKFVQFMQASVDKKN